MDFDSIKNAIKKEANASFLFYTTSIITHYIWAQVGIICPLNYAFLNPMIKEVPTFNSDFTSICAL
jgi:hypothetical protein